MAEEKCVSTLVEQGVPQEEAQELCRVAYEYLDREKDEFSLFNSAQVLEDERYVLGPVLIPYHVDKNRNIFPPSVIRQTAHTFMERYKKNKLMHLIEFEDNEDGVTIVESFIVPTDNFVINGKEYPKGTWMLGLKVHNDAAWNHIKNGNLRGFSIGGKLSKGYTVIEDVIEE